MSESRQPMAHAIQARRVSLRGVVQGVGFRPFAYRLAQMVGVTGWVANSSAGLEIHAEGTAVAIADFVRRLETEAPDVAHIEQLAVAFADVEGSTDFRISASDATQRPLVRIAADLPVCEECLHEMSRANDRRWRYPYINCTNCGPRFSLIVRLPYDRARTTMAAWTLCAECSREFHDAGDRRFHAQPIACPDCGPRYRLEGADDSVATNWSAVETAASLLASGAILAIKGLGGYLLACDARNRNAVFALRERKYRREKPFAMMAKNLTVAHDIVQLTAQSAALMQSSVRPIVLARAKREFPGVAPDHQELGVMLPYAPIHHLLFDAGAPEVLVMTSGNRSSEPIAIGDPEARQTLGGIADAFLVGERPIARRVDDSVARLTPFGPMMLRRSRGAAPGVAAQLPATRPILALGADLKNTITLVIDGEAFVSQHVGDLQYHAANVAFHETARDFLQMYDVDAAELIVAHDSHPQYKSTVYARRIQARQHIAVQHHHAHIASVLAERGELERRVLGVAFDGTGYGEAETMWGGEFFVGSVREGFERVAHLHSAFLPGGDAASQFPPQAAAGYVAELRDVPDLTRPPFCFPARYNHARLLLERRICTFVTTSMGRLFDSVAALLGFTHAISYEGQAAIWLENIARRGADGLVLSIPFLGAELDYRPLLEGVISARVRGCEAADIALAFHAALARGTTDALRSLGSEHGVDTVVLSGGVFQNALLLELLAREFDAERIWTNGTVPPNDGGISLGQAALAAVR